MTDAPEAPTDFPDAARWRFPDSEICSAAVTLVTDVSPAVLSNHCIRSYVFAREIAASQDLRSGIDYDDETLYLACLLHDLGLTDHGSGDERFEIQGADAAQRFLRRHDSPEGQITTVWQSIALHSSLGLAPRFGTVQSLSIAGISFDIDGIGMERFSADFIDRVLSVWPRHNVGFALGHHIARDVATHPGKPLKAPPFTLPGHLDESINDAPHFTFSDLITSAAWGDQPTHD